jgi:hypothetical protein
MPSRSLSDITGGVSTQSDTSIKAARPFKSAATVPAAWRSWRPFAGPRPRSVDLAAAGPFRLCTRPLVPSDAWCAWSGQRNMVGFDLKKEVWGAQVFFHRPLVRSRR